MTERTVSLNSVAAIGLWITTGVFITAGTVVGLLNPAGSMHPIVMALMAYGLGCAAGATTMSVRLMIRRQNSLLRDAFALGQDSAGSSSMRRVH